MNDKSIDDCIDSGFMKELSLDGIITESFIRHLGKAGELQYFPSFARPFFRVDVDNRFIIKGIQGSKTFKVFFSRDNYDIARECLVQLVASFPQLEQIET